MLYYNLLYSRIPYSFMLYSYVNKIDLGDFHSSRYFFIVKRRRTVTNFGRIVPLFYYRCKEVVLCRMHKNASNFIPNTNPQATSPQP